MKPPETPRDVVFYAAADYDELGVDLATDQAMQRLEPLLAGRIDAAIGAGVATRGSGKMLAHAILAPATVRSDANRLDQE